MLNGRMNGKRAMLRLFDEARLDTGSIVDWLHWRLGEGARIRSTWRIAVRGKREGDEYDDGDWMI